MGKLNFQSSQTIVKKLKNNIAKITNQISL